MLELLLNGALFVVAGRHPAFRYWLGYHFLDSCVMQDHKTWWTGFGEELWLEDTTVPDDRLSTVKRYTRTVLNVILYGRSSY